MIIFENFPDDKICLMCGTSEDKACVLIPVDGTSDGTICEKVPVHVECAQKGNLRFNRELHVFYRRAVEVVEL